jgi:hypothetical protein
MADFWGLTGRLLMPLTLDKPRPFVGGAWSFIVEVFIMQSSVAWAWSSMTAKQLLVWTRFSLRNEIERNKSRISLGALYIQVAADVKFISIE